MPNFTTIRDGVAVAVLETEELWSLVEDYLSYLSFHNQVNNFNQFQPTVYARLFGTYILGLFWHKNIG